jgi:hypothetical protein
LETNESVTARMRSTPKLFAFVSDSKGSTYWKILSREDNTYREVAYFLKAFIWHYLCEPKQEEPLGALVCNFGVSCGANCLGHRRFSLYQDLRKRSLDDNVRRRLEMITAL